MGLERSAPIFQESKLTYRKGVENISMIKNFAFDISANKTGNPFQSPKPGAGQTVQHHI